MENENELKISAQVTEAHRAITESVCELLDSEEMVGPSPAERAAQLIADSEAKACAELRAEAEELRFLHQCESDSSVEAYARAERAEAELATAKAIIASIEEDGTEEHNAAVRLRRELATERARLDWLLSRMGGNVLPANKCVAWTVDVYHYGNRFPSRAAIDAAMKGHSK